MKYENVFHSLAGTGLNFLPDGLGIVIFRQILSDRLVDIQFQKAP